MYLVDRVTNHVIFSKHLRSIKTFNTLYTHKHDQGQITRQGTDQVFENSN